MIVDSTQHGHKINMILFGEAIAGRRGKERLSKWSGDLSIEKMSKLTLFRKIGNVVFDG